MQRMRATVMGLRHRTTAVTGTQLRLLCLGPTLLLLSIRAAAAPCDFKFVDKDGDEWDLETLSGVRTSSGPATTGTYTYKFDICANISPNPTSCELAGVYGTVAARYVRKRTPHILALARPTFQPPDRAVQPARLTAY